jgi:DNA repair photolyase
MASVTTYKHAVSVTSQAYFCAAPIRIDSYNTCQLGCVYCFSRTRARAFASSGIHSANADALRERFRRIKAGGVASALDEFLRRRIPIQLGGLQDPFTPLEAREGVTLELLKVLRDERYPTLISTKGSLFLDEEYLNVLSEMNVVFRISAAGIDEALRPVVERKCDPFSVTLKKIRALCKRGIPVALRLQPVFPRFEKAALRMATKAARAGASRVTFEYLKLPSESMRTDFVSLTPELGYDVIATMSEMGLKKIGPDWSLSPDAKRNFVRAARRHCHRLGIRFGAGDTEFIPWSDGDGCCGSTNEFLNGSAQFTANFVGVIKHAVRTPSKRVRFSQLRRRWSPQLSVGNYFDGRSRVSAEDRGNETDWFALMARRWNLGSSPYSPAFFDGVLPTKQKDAEGFTVYDASPLAAELAR